MFVVLKPDSDQSTILFGASVIMPPRWGLGFVEAVGCYKHVAPPALKKSANQ